VNLFVLAGGIVCSAGAQIMIKTASRFASLSGLWIASMSSAIILYGFSFLLYSLLLRTTAISRASPIMTIATAAIVVASGVILFAEQISLRQGLGLVLGLASILLMSF
jgi:multidrug transporter EmrE-like cation transporter